MNNSIPWIESKFSGCFGWGARWFGAASRHCPSRTVSERHRSSKKTLGGRDPNLTCPLASFANLESTGFGFGRLTAKGPGMWDGIMASICIHVPVFNGRVRGISSRKVAIPADVHVQNETNQATCVVSTVLTVDVPPDCATEDCDLELRLEELRDLGVDTAQRGRTAGPHASEVR